MYSRLYLNSPKNLKPFYKILGAQTSPFFYSHKQHILLFMKQYFKKLFVWWFYRLLYLSWRIEIYESPELKAALKNQEPIIMAHWHGDELGLLHLVRKYSLATMTSTSKDGSLIDYVIAKLGGQTSRGSSTRGGVQALKGLIRLCKSGHPVSFAVDGPRGPIYQVKPGVFELSRLMSAEVFPVGLFADKKYVFSRSWNRAVLPKPFSKVRIYYDKPMKALDKNSDPKSMELSQTLAERIHFARNQAANMIARSSEAR